MDFKYEAGFTLIEAMVTITIAAILLAIAMPSMQNILVENRLTTRTNELVTDIITAKSESIRRGMRVGMCAANATLNGCSGSNNWETGWILFVDSNSNAAYDAGELILKVHDSLPGGLTLLAEDFTTTDFITFLPSGRINSTGKFTMCKSSYQSRVIELNITGRTDIDKSGSICT